MLDEDVELEDNIGSAEDEDAAGSESSSLNLSRASSFSSENVDLVSVLIHCIRMPFIVFVSVSSDSIALSRFSTRCSKSSRASSLVRFAESEPSSARSFIDQGHDGIVQCNLHQLGIDALLLSDSSRSLIPKCKWCQRNGISAVSHLMPFSMIEGRCSRHVR